ncbi:restriction endonuclease subunit M [Christensenellaceae bacterium NSJ-63]|uniref:Restriction endonuclease subunit M n=1 Tax=Guopingia tenuis TaxID=2763656 RepID=A0A926HVJ8_9FIRM|nr:restriction endonuclease subunit M [Guopingia tenuis]MBC8537393.1 restriction endonuclease subunit M [Guopingia tenuis]
MKELNLAVDRLLSSTNGDQKIIESIKTEKTLYPFSAVCKLLTYFVSIGELTYDEFSELSISYSQRNKYLDLYEMAPRTYGQTWGEQHIRSLFPQFIKATKENVSSEYPSFDGEFDLWLKGIRIEVKACRANYEKGNGSLASRAYLHSEAKAAGFKYHYQQLKPSCCDVFIWIGTCRDELIYWVLTSQELLYTGKLGSQHRNENTGVAGIEVFEGQVFMTEEELSPFLVEEKDILKMVQQKGTKA